MKPEKQRIAIAEACGWRFEKHSQGTRLINPDGEIENNHYAEEWRLPDYLNDLNAMHDVECYITVGQMGRYLSALSNIVQPQATYHPMDLQWWTVRATAAQRAEAFLRTINKWEESE